MKLLYISEHPNAATGFYRGAGILKNLSELYPEGLDYDVVNANTVAWSWSEFINYDVAWFERPATGQSLQFATYLKKLKIPIIVDYDDALFHIPEENEAHFFYTGEVKKAIVQLLSMADKVIVSTPELKKHLWEKAEVIRNALDFEFLKAPKEPTLDYVYWRGTPTHAEDIYNFREGIAEGLENYRKGKFIFHGYNPHYLTKNNKVALYRPLTDIFTYFQEVKARPPKIMIVPLTDNIFNRCKSNIAALEGIYFGAQVLAPDFPEWQIPGIINYKDTTDFRNKLLEILNKGCENKPESLDYVKRVHNLPIENSKRKKILDEI